ncbi:hypothetical protein GCM10027600_39270 [Nocardioides ginsengisegetis]
MLGGPLGPGGDSVTSCMTKRDATDMVVGLDVVRNASDEPVTLDSAELVGATRVTLTAARVADVSGDRSLLGHVQGDPPREMSDEQRLLMRSSRPLTGFALAPASTGAIDNVLMYLHLEDPEVTAEIEHLRVYYHQGSHHYIWQDNAHFILAAGPGCAALPS